MKLTDLIAAKIVIWRVSPAGRWALRIPGLPVRTAMKQADLIAYLAYQARMA